MSNRIAYSISKTKTQTYTCRTGNLDNTSVPHDWAAGLDQAPSSGRDRPTALFLSPSQHTGASIRQQPNQTTHLKMNTMAML